MALGGLSMGNGIGMGAKIRRLTQFKWTEAALTYSEEQTKAAINAEKAETTERKKLETK